VIAAPRHLRDVATTPWKNGRGTTRELLRVASSDDADGFVLRVSIASVASDAAFSVYPGIDRMLTVWRGAGIALIDATAQAAWRTLSEPFDIATFEGERALEGRLLDGPILDFNVMVRRDSAVASLSVIAAGQSVSAKDCRLLFAARGHVRVACEDGSEHVLKEAEFIEPVNALHIATSRDAVAFVVTFRPVTPSRSVRRCD
jgi:uncharacterized protein